MNATLWVSPGPRWNWAAIHCFEGVILGALAPTCSRSCAEELGGVSADNPNLGQVKALVVRSVQLVVFNLRHSWRVGEFSGEHP